MAEIRYRHGWTQTHFLLAAALAAVGVVATLAAWMDIFHIAIVDEEASHIFLVLPISAWLIWVRRGRFRTCQRRGLWIGPPAALLGWILSAWGYWFSVQVLFHAGAVLLVVGCVLSVLGRDFLFRFLPAFAVLVFLVPIPGRVRQQVAIPMQTATAKVTQSVFDLLGEPIDRSGNVLSINGKQVAIAEACNGQRMVFALVLVSFAFAFGEPLRQHVRISVLVLSPICAIVCNVGRMVPTIWFYGHSSVPIADGFHNWAGWIMLVIAFWLLKSVTSVMRWAAIPVGHYRLASS